MLLLRRVGNSGWIGGRSVNSAVTATALGRLRKAPPQARNENFLWPKKLPSTTSGRVMAWAT
jgi:hypothetical protein